MKVMIIIMLLNFVLNLNLLISRLEGNWKLVEYSGFSTIIASPNFNNLTEEQKIKASESFQFALDNTFYSFKEDSVFFTDAGGDFIVKEKKGRFLVNSDTLIIMEAEKFKIHRFYISSQNEKELKMRIVYNNGSVGPTEMTFEKVD